MEPVYILLRTSGRPKYFEKCYESIKNLTYKNIILIVHSDDPRDTYVKGDYIIKGECFTPWHGSAPYNLYNNRLLKALPGPGWVHFMDDDDIYAQPDVFERLTENADKRKLQVGRVERWPDRQNPEVRTVFPRGWGTQKSFQTECFIVWSDIAKKAKWWSDKGGDHYYSKQLTRVTRINWVDDVIIASAIECKGHGRRLDEGREVADVESPFKPHDKVYFKVAAKNPKYQQGKLIEVPYAEAEILEKHNYGRITYKGAKLYHKGQVVKDV
jgi:glycosyltransferase involved in cell wall biosynthesis